MNASPTPNDRDQIVEHILLSVRGTVRDLVYQGKDPDGIGRLIACTMGSMRALAPYLGQADTALALSTSEVEEVQAVISMIPDDVRPLFDAGILSGAHPLSYARRIQDMIAAATVEETAA